MAYFRNITERRATASAYVSIGRWRDYEVEPGAVVEVADPDANVFASQPQIFERCEAPAPTPEPEPVEAPKSEPKLAAVAPIRRRR